MKIEDVWNLLEQDGSNTTSGYLTRRILPEVNYDIYLAIEKPLDTRLLILRVKSVLLDRKTIYPSSRSFVVNRIALQQDNEEYATLQLVLTNPRHKDIFTTLVQDIVDSLALVSEERAAVSEFITRLKRWQTFLEKNNSEGLSEIAQQGLYGELWFLRTSSVSKFRIRLKDFAAGLAQKQLRKIFSFLDVPLRSKQPVQSNIRHYRSPANANLTIRASARSYCFTSHSICARSKERDYLK